MIALEVVQRHTLRANYLEGMNTKCQMGLMNVTTLGILVLGSEAVTSALVQGSGIDAV